MTGRAHRRLPGALLPASHRRLPGAPLPRRLRRAAALAPVLLAVLLSACSTAAPSATPTAGPGTSRRTGPSSSGRATTTTLANAKSGPGPTASTGPPCTDASVIASWPVGRRAAQLLVVPILDADPASVRIAVGDGAGGVLLLGSVPPGTTLVSALGSAINDPTTPRPFVMVDQEGGGVQRLGADVLSLPWARQMAATMSTSEVQASAERLGRQMAALGVGVDLAPVLDLDGGPALSTTDPDGPRSFSTDPSVASRYGLAFATGLQAGGVLAVAKHFPGLGGATGNTDYGPASTRPFSDLQSAGLVPFERLFAGGVRAVMVANATVPGLTATPASLSTAAITGLLRDRLHFGGLVMTDSLSAGAISGAGFSLAAAVVAAVGAGADMVLFGSTLTPADTAALKPGPLASTTQGLISAIAGAVSRGTLPASRLDDAVLHVLQAKGVDLCPTA